MYTRNETKWVSADGNTYIVKDMTTSHLVNTLNWIKKHSTRYPTDLYLFLEDEARYRATLAFCSNNAIPIKLDTGWWAIKNQSFIGYAKSLFYKYRGLLKIAIQDAKRRSNSLFIK